ncbi:MAG TPA: hypothetical protein PKZ32_10445, partial [Candidatus Melainabacteria bacterium]|nr:hypothetical protein [Candidatus Melainabacteria bacterium]
MFFEEFLQQSQENNNAVSNDLEDQLDWVVDYASQTLTSSDSLGVEAVVRDLPHAFARVATPEAISSVVHQIEEIAKLPEGERLDYLARQVISRMPRELDAVSQESAPKIDRSVVQELARANAPAVQEFVREVAPAAQAILKESAPVVQELARANAPAVQEFVR